MTTAERKMAAVKRLQAVVTTDGEGHVTLTRTQVAEAIRVMRDAVRSDKWRQAVDLYVELVEDDSNPLEWAYYQGSVWFAHRVF